MSEFGGLQKYEKTKHAFVELGSAAIATTVALPCSNASPISHKGLMKFNHTHSHTNKVF